MDSNLPFQLAQQRDAIIREIHAAFDGATRVQGVSWGEARVIDGNGSLDDRRLAQEMDREPNWQALTENEDLFKPWSSEWSFLDAIGFRYYLAAALVQLVRTGEDPGFRFHLMLTLESGEYGRQWLEVLDLRQKHCVRRAIEHAVALCRLNDSVLEARWWREAYLSYWTHLPPLDRSEQ